LRIFSYLSGNRAGSRRLGELRPTIATTLVISFALQQHARDRLPRHTCSNTTIDAVVSTPLHEISTPRTDTR
jgi:hypothetical protein